MYILSCISIISFFLNIVCLIGFLKMKNKKSKIYKFLVWKTLSELISLLISTLIPYGQCQKCSAYQSYGSLFYSTYILNFLAYIAYTYSGFCELLVTYKRYTVLKPSSRLSFHRSDNLLIGIFLLVSIAIFIPVLFSKSIQEIPNSFGKY